MAEGGKAGDLKACLDYMSTCVCSSLKVKDEAFQKLLQGETRYVDAVAVYTRTGLICRNGRPCQIERGIYVYRAPFMAFLEQPDMMRLLFFVDGKDLTVVSVYACRKAPCACLIFIHLVFQVNKPPGRFRHKKTCYFIKSAPGKIDAENIKKIVRPLGLHVGMFER